MILSSATSSHNPETGFVFWWVVILVRWCSVFNRAYGTGIFNRCQSSLLIISSIIHGIRWVLGLFTWTLDEINAFKEMACPSFIRNMKLLTSCDTTIMDTVSGFINSLFLNEWTKQTNRQTKKIFRLAFNMNIFPKIW